MKLSSIVRPLALVGAMLGCGLAQANLIQNGDFATNANGWTYNNEDVDGGYLAGEGNPPGSFWINHNGQNLAGGDLDPRLSQVIATSAGTQYDLTFDYAGRVITGGLGLAVDIGGIEQATFAIVTNGLDHRNPVIRRYGSEHDDRFPQRDQWHRLRRKNR